MTDHGETITGPQPTPVLHKSVPMGVRVKLPDHYHSEDHEVWGEVQGVASMQILWSYIILLDAPLTISVGTVRAVTVPGPELEGEDGINWRHDSP